MFDRLKIPLYKALKNKKCGQTLVIDKATSCIRPHCVAAVLRNVTFTKERYLNPICFFVTQLFHIILYTYIFSGMTASLIFKINCIKTLQEKEHLLLLAPMIWTPSKDLLDTLLSRQMKSNSNPWINRKSSQPRSLWIYIRYVQFDKKKKLTYLFTKNYNK